MSLFHNAVLSLVRIQAVAPCALDKLMAGFTVVGAIRINMSQRDFRRHDIVAHRIYRQMQLAPHSPFFGAVFADLSLTFTKHLQPG